MVWTFINCFYSKKKLILAGIKVNPDLFLFRAFYLCVNGYIFLVCQGVLSHMDPPSLWRSRDGAGSFLFLSYLCVYYFRLVLQLLYCVQLCWWITNSLNCRFIEHNSSDWISARVLGSILSSDWVFLEYVVLLMRHPGRLDFSICHAFMAKDCAACLVTSELKNRMIFFCLGVFLVFLFFLLRNAKVLYGKGSFIGRKSFI